MKPRTRGSTLIESSVVAAVFLLLVAGIEEFARLGFAYNEVSFAAQQAARYASVRGAASGHPAAAADIQAAAEVYTGALDNSKVTVTTAWTPDNNPGSTVKVTVQYQFATLLRPLASGAFTISTSSAGTITQ